MTKLVLDGDQGSSTIPVIPEGDILEATVESVKEKESDLYKNDDGTAQKSVEFCFRVVGPSYKNRLLWGNASTWFSSSPTCRLRNWVQEILSVDELPSGFEFDPDAKDLDGLACRVLVGHRKSGKEYVADVFRSTGDDAVSPDEVF